ncbi:MAG: ABC transporter permease [Desulfurispora sp.]|uniref:ABC transporter permease n=1 Tax=Desulfurispora sp. TaxID=3014275 RepID=UPI00404A8437
MKFWYIACNDLKILSRDIPSIIYLFITPIIVIAIASFALSGLWNSGTAVFRIPVVQLDDGELAQEFMAHLRQVKALELETSYEEDGRRYSMDEKTARRLIKERKAAIIIPRDFTSRVRRGQLASIVVLQDPVDRVVPSVVADITRSIISRFSTMSTGIQTAQTATGVLQQDVQRQGGGVDPRPALRRAADVAEALVEEPPVVVTVKTAVAEQRRVTPFEANVPGYAVMFILFGTAGAAGSLLQEKEEGTIRRLLTMPVSRADILAGKMTASFLQSLLQALVLFAVGHLVFGMWLGRDLPALGLVILATCVAATGLGMLLASLCRTRSQVSGVSVLVVLAMSALGGSWWPIYIVPEWMQKVAHITLTAWAMDGFNALLTYGGDMGDVLLPVAVLVGMGVLFFGIALSRFRLE